MRGNWGDGSRSFVFGVDGPGRVCDTSRDSQIIRLIEGRGNDMQLTGELARLGSRSVRWVVAAAMVLPMGAMADDKSGVGEVAIYASGFQSCVPIYAGGAVSGWNGVFGAWPAYNANARVSVSTTQYLSLMFVAPSVPNQQGTLVTAGAPGVGGGESLISISAEPGCFDPAIVGANCVSAVSANPSLPWSQLPALDRCVLEPNRAYYVNVAAAPSCTIAGCVTDLRNLAQ